MPFDSLNLPSIITKNFNAIKKDIQGKEIIMSPTTEAKLPNPLQPSINYMETALPSQLQSMAISKLSNATDCILSSKLRQLLPTPLAAESRKTPLLSPPMIFTDVKEERNEDFDIPEPTTDVESEEPDTSFNLHPSTSSTSSTSSSSTSSSGKKAISKQYFCSLCPKKFMRPSSLKIHVYSHTGEKPFNCSYPGCRRKFSVQSNMRRHLRVHSN